MKEAIVKEEDNSGELLQIRVKSSAEKEEEEKEYQQWYEEEKKINKVYVVLFIMNGYHNEQMQSFIGLRYRKRRTLFPMSFVKILRTVILKNTSRQLLLYLLLLHLSLHFVERLDCF